MEIQDVGARMLPQIRASQETLAEDVDDRGSGVSDSFVSRESMEDFPLSFT